MIEKFYTGEELAAIAYLRENPDMTAKIVELVKTTPPDPAKAKIARKAARKTLRIELPQGM